MYLRKTNACLAFAGSNIFVDYITKVIEAGMKIDMLSTNHNANLIKLHLLLFQIVQKYKNGRDEIGLFQQDYIGPYGENWNTPLSPAVFKIRC